MQLNKIANNFDLNSEGCTVDYNSITQFLTNFNIHEMNSTLSGPFML